MSIKRFKWESCDVNTCHCDIVENVEGSMVEYDDYCIEVTSLKSRLKESQRVLAQLAVENAGLKAAIDATIGWQQSTDPENVESVRMLVDIKTPATEAFLAEAQAKGVERFADHLRTNDNEASVCKMIAMGAEEFAAKLRQGGAA
jgi:hypothetical protein